jgi:hypothetical protein
MSGLAIPYTGKNNSDSLLIHADPGARSGFIATWLTDRLTSLAFDSGVAFGPPFRKIHYLNNVKDITDHPGFKIRVRPSIHSIDVLSLLFLRKNVYKQYTDFTRDEYSFETFSKLTRFSQELFGWDQELDYALYDTVIDFADTFNNSYMIELYRKFVGRAPTPDMIDMLIKTNDLNRIPMDRNHACSIVKLCFTQEHLLGLKEQNRYWSVVDVYKSTPVDQLYDTVLKLIVPENYGKILS